MYAYICMHANSYTPQNTRTYVDVFNDDLTYKVPVLVAAESYKFSDKVQLDSIVFNELGSGAEIASMQPASGLGQGGNPSEVKGGGPGEGSGESGGMCMYILYIHYDNCVV